MKRQGTWQVFGQRILYNNPWVRLVLVDVEAPNGKRLEHHVVHLGRVAVALVVNDADEVLMLWRYRFATEQWGYELLGGLVDGDEDAAATAKRETVEESGWLPVGEPEHLLSFEPLPGMVTSRIDAFLWHGAERVGEPTDLEEAGRVEWVPLARMPELARRGELLGAGTLAPVFFYLSSRAAG